VPRLYFAANSGARFGMAEDVRSAFGVEWTDQADPTRGFKHLYLNKEDKVRKQNYFFNRHCMNEYSTNIIELIII
jgi:acetyl-CoA carboxylase / biotin carboxylase 1